MSRPLRKTLLDYLVIAISPALIITLVGSLVLFLIEVFYQGSFQGRLQYIFGLFVIGAVLVGRISIEDGRERSMLFALPLGIVTLLAINRFIAFHGELASLSFPINCGLIGLVWWSADKLTWDCTLIDDREEDPGEGLLEAVGLDRPDRTPLHCNGEESDGETPLHCNGEESDGETPLHCNGEESDGETPLHCNGEESDGETPLHCNGGDSWWERFLERRRRPHAPGVWVVYFSLAAVALFGIGQVFIPNENLQRRQYAFQLLVVYTASGLALLLSTSFLGLRRYLRQRRQEMPLRMVNLWLGIGGALIVGVMAAAMLLPRPNAEYAVWELPFRAGSPDQKSSRYGTGRDGVKEKQPWARGQRPDESTDESEKSADTAKGEKPSRQPGSSPSASRDRGRQGEKSPKASQGPPADDQSQDTDPSKPDQQSGENSKDAKEPPPSHASRPHPSPLPEGVGTIIRDTPAMMVALFKWLLYGALGLLAIFWLWKNHKALLAALGNFGQWLSNLWNGLFGRAAPGVEADAGTASPKAAPRRQFAEFTNPFAAGTAGQCPPEDLVRYTFEALEAWARDHGYPREPEQTPHEFARALAKHVSPLADETGRLADLYCRAAYAPGTLSAASAASLAHLWQILTQSGGNA